MSSNSTNNSKEQSPLETDSSTSDKTEPTQATTKETKSNERTKKSDPVRRTTLIIVSVCALLFVWYILADRFVPYTDQAKVQGYVVPIAPEVSGTVTKINVINNQVVKAGDVMVEIDPQRYETALASAEADLVSAEQEIGAGGAAVKSAEAKLADSQADLMQAQQDFDRVQSIFKQDPGAVSKAERDKTRNALAEAKALVANAQAELERAKEELGSLGEDNPRLKSARSALEKARIDLADTKIYAPSLGGVTDLRIDVGHYAMAGQPLMTFISATDVWIEANMRENSFGNVKAGNEVEIVLDSVPGRVFKGKVASIGWGVGHGQNASLGALRKIEEESGWLRDAQRFPIIIKFVSDVEKGRRRVGGQADVVIYTGDHTILNALGWFWIRLMSILSYVY